MSDKTDTSGARPDLLGDFLRTVFSYYHRNLKPEVMKLYRQGLSGIPLNFLEDFFQEHLKTPETVKHPSPPSIASFVGAWQSHRRRQILEEEQSTTFDKDLSPEEEARRLLIAHVALRLSGHLPKEGAPDLVHRISIWAAERFNRQYPNGLPANPAECGEILQGFIDDSLKLFDEEIQANHEETT